jgi:UDPglucose--hexose-1-phosphate uridylyltransferase
VPELRKDPVLGHWVLFPGAPALESVPCPMCAAAGELGDRRAGLIATPRAILDRRSIVDRARHAGDLYTSMTGAGEHETILETKEHGARMADLDERHIAEILGLYRERLLFLRQDNRFRHMVIVKNEGLAAGALADHACSEVFALPFIPESVKAKMMGIQGHHRRSGNCIFCDIVRTERHEKSRKIAESIHHLAVAPYASRSPYEVMILPKGHQPDFAATSDPDLLDAAVLLSDVLRRIDRALGDPPLSLIVENAPADAGADPEAFHWHIEVHPVVAAPRALDAITRVNWIEPEEAARRLREAESRTDPA